LAGPWRLWVIGVALFAPVPALPGRSLVVPLAAAGLGGTGLGLGAIGV
jgi:hypothetical protein